MLLREWLDNLNEQVKESPEMLDMPVITAIDDEGNGFNEVHSYAGTVIFDGEELIDEEDCTDCEENAVLLN